VGERYAETTGLIVSVDLPRAERDLERHRLDRHGGQQLVREPLAPIAPFGSVGASDTVGEFEDRDDRDGDLLVAHPERNVFEQLAGIPPVPLRRDDRRRVKD
jgi:hypothetical protein